MCRGDTESPQFVRKRRLVGDSGEGSLSRVSIVEHPAAGSLFQRRLAASDHANQLHSEAFDRPLIILQNQDRSFVLSRAETRLLSRQPHRLTCCRHESKPDIDLGDHLITKTLLTNFVGASQE